MTHLLSSTITRRAALASGAALFAWSFIPSFVGGGGSRDPRLVVLVLRGALDGLIAAPPVGDPDHEALRGRLALTRSGENTAPMLDSFFGLHPSMPQFARLWSQGEAMLVHAVATPYRGRSHFDGQDVLESGQAGPGRVDSGWLNRALTTLPAGERIEGPARGLAVGVTTPLILRGSASITGWSPAAVVNSSDDLAQRLSTLYGERDPALQANLRQALALDAVARRETGDLPRSGADAAMRLPARGAAKLLAADDGPRIAALSFNGWDTHANAGAARGRVADLLAGLDAAFHEFEKGLGPQWRNTVVVALSEFGRTARVNGTSGTDHGVGGVCFIAGGAVAGGRVIADWPGLRQANLFEGRDLAPTTDLRAVLKGVLADHLGISPAALARIVFPGSDAVRPLANIIRTA
jgi:uncharacterized protein (DUF1501 family)